MKKILRGKKTSFLFFIITIALFMFSGFVFSLSAADNRCGSVETSLKPLSFVFNVPLPGFNNNAPSLDIDCMTLGDYIKYIYKFTIGVTGLLAVFMITLGGITWIFAGGNSGKISQAKQYITGAISGILLAIGSYSVLYIINPQLIEVKPVQIPLAKKALLPICPDSGLSQTNDKKTFVSVKDATNKTSGQNTWCGMEYKVDGSDSDTTCWGMACNVGGNTNRVCTPIKEGTGEESLDFGKYEKYQCMGAKEAKIALIKGCNNVNDTTTNNKKAQEETQDACGDFNKIKSKFPKNYFTENESCVWIDYSWFNVLKTGTNQDTCRWCPESYYKVIKYKMENGQCDLFSANTDQTNGLCKKDEDGCFEAGIDDNSEDKNGHEYTVDACVRILYPKICNKK